MTIKGREAPERLSPISALFGYILILWLFSVLTDTESVIRLLVSLKNRFIKAAGQVIDAFCLCFNVLGGPNVEMNLRNVCLSTILY